jgi:hypothetical protein
MDIDLSKISPEELTALLEKQKERRKISDELNEKALHPLLAGRCAEATYGCRQT